MNIWKSYICTAEIHFKKMKIIPVIYLTQAVEEKASLKKKKKKNNNNNKKKNKQAWTRFEPRSNPIQAWIFFRPGFSLTA